ncbi:MAG: hypothetical protein HQL75_00205 [Magnetococcales bacterium]|nr:hypothetical protein [Magnetococcales bacterium]
MANPLAELQALIAGKVALRGVVFSIGPERMKIATQKGMYEVQNDQSIKVGDSVTIKDGKAVKVKAANNAPVCFV